MESTKEPITTQELAQAAHVGWSTALRIALELMAQSKVQGIKTTNGWVFFAGELESKGK